VTVSERDLEGTSFFITGANAGIGRETALSLARRGATLLLAGRSAERTRPVVDECRAQGSPEVSFLRLELDDLGSVRACAEAFLASGRPLDVLIANAGLAGKHGLTRDGFELIFGVNHLGHFALTESLKPRLLDSAARRSAPARVVVVSSVAHRQARRIDWQALRQPTKSLVTTPEYRVSKLCNVLHARALARRLAPGGVHTYSLHPGVIASEIWREVPWPVRPLMKRFMRSTAEGARTTVFCAASPDVGGQSGLYYDECRAVEPSRLALDDALADELFERSLRWTGLG
jgi:NAD(P)-dependent dehydrogenase (short-subunit alcohol dehydrogenase family)